MTDLAEQPSAVTETIADLDSVFEGNETTDETVAEVTTTEETKTAEPVVEEAKGEEAETPSEEEKPVPFAALKDERRKRQEFEERYAEAAAELAKLKEKPAPDPVEDPEGYAKFVNGEALKTKINLSRDVMLSLDAYKSDYPEMEQHFVAMAKVNPMLAVQMNASPNPAKFAYDTAKEDKEIQKLRDPKYKETLEAEIRAKILADLDVKPKKSIVTVPDLTKATAKGSNSTPVETLPDLKEMFGDSPF